MDIPIIADRSRLYELAAWTIAGLVGLLGFRYIRQLIAIVLTELHYWLIQRGFLPL